MQSDTGGTITVVMITADRVARGKSRNYLADTIANMERAGIFRSKYLSRFRLFPTETERWFNFGGHIMNYGTLWPDRNMLPCENAGRALMYAETGDSDWLLFMEDDLDFCADFLESVALWLSNNATDDERVYSFGCAYSALMEQAYSCAICGGKSDNWQHVRCAKPRCHPFMQRSHKLTYPGLNTFYGTQCFAVRSSDAISLGEYMYSNPIFPDGLRHPNSYDLMVSQWIEREYSSTCTICGKLSDNKDYHDSRIAGYNCYHAFEPMSARAIVASVPSFVQHIGKESICTDIDPSKVHEFSTWQGREWKYEN